MEKTTAFFKAFLKESKGVGSIAPSSRFLQRKMVKPIDFQQAKCIVELGPGEGCITRTLLQKMGPDTRLLSFETHRSFVDRFLQFEDPRISVINDSAEFIGKYLKAHGFEKADYIVSSLPLTNFPKDLKESILNEAKSNLAPGGIYMQYQYSTSALKLLRQKFHSVKVGYAPINIPPAFVYTCQN